MDADTKKEVKKALKFYLKQPMFIWLGLSFVLLFTEAIFENHPDYAWITLGFALLYTFCMIMFMLTLEKARTASMKYFEGKQVDFIRKSIGIGHGTIMYMHECLPEGVIRNFRRKLGTKYLCPYTASFEDTGTVHQKAHIAIPVSKRQMFQLKLMGCFETKNRERAVKALEYLGVEWPLP